MVSCTECGAAIEENSKFCAKCGRPANGLQIGRVGIPSADLTILLKDIELGQVSRKVEAIGKLFTTSGVQLSDVQGVLQSALQSAPAGSLLKFYVAYTLAFFGDNTDLVAEAVQSFMGADPFDGPGDTLVSFPWTAVPEDPPLHPATIDQRTRKFSTQLAVLEAFGFMRGSEIAARGLSKCLEVLQRTSWRLWAIYAAGANGYPMLRSTLEYLRDREQGSVEAEAARLALEHFGTSTVLEIAEFHARLAPVPKLEEKKSGCFIATAAFDTVDSPEVTALRAFRDEILCKSSAGRSAVEVYYRYSPKIATHIRRSNILKHAARCVLRVTIHCLPHPKSLKTEKFP
jgi:hypothetical protein